MIQKYSLDEFHHYTIKKIDNVLKFDLFFISHISCPVCAQIKKIFHGLQHLEITISKNNCGHHRFIFSYNLLLMLSLLSADFNVMYRASYR